MRKLRYFTELARFLEKLPKRENQRVAKARQFWVQFLARPPESEKEWERAYRYADDWRFCACGATLPRELRKGGWINARPSDEELHRLGNDFSRYVSHRDYLKARHTFLHIQRREAELIREQGLTDLSYN